MAISTEEVKDSEKELEELIELYDGNLSLPVYTRNKQVLSPEGPSDLYCK